MVTSVMQRVLKKKQSKSTLSGVRQAIVCVHSTTELENCLYAFMSSLSEGVFNWRSNDYYFQLESQSMYEPNSLLL